LTGRYSTRFHLIGLATAVVVPLTAFAGLVLYRYEKNQQLRVEREILQVAQQTGLLVDAELTKLTAKLEGLASSSALTTDDFERFHAEAALLTRDREETIILRDLGVRQIFNSQLSFGAPLPNGPPFSSEERSRFNQGRPYVSDVYSSPRSGEPRIVVALPILRDGGPKYVLGITIPTSRIRDAYLSSVPAGFIVAVGDRKGAYVARSVRHDEMVGKPGLPEYVQQVVGKSGTFKSSNFEGRQLLAGYYRSDLSSWFFTANIPAADIEEPVEASLAQLGWFGVGALVLSGLLALWFSQGIVAAAGGLAQRARDLGRGAPITPISTHLAEFALINDALVAASDEISAREVHRQLLVNELNHRVKNSLTIAQSIAAQTLRSARSLPEARTALSARLVSLALTHDVLTKENWEGANVEDIVSQATEPFGADNRIAASGSFARLLPSPALTLSLILHELLTNSSKYGALSSDTGSVSITWKAHSGAPVAQSISLVFKELGGPAVKAPSYAGFGSRLFAGSFASPKDGRLRISYLPGGVVCEIEINGTANAG
jgi:two-component sensor histidine kinase